MVRLRASLRPGCLLAIYGLLILPTASYPQQGQQPGAAVQAPPVAAPPGQQSTAGPSSQAQPARVPLSAQNGVPGNGTGDPNLPLEFESHGLDYEALTREGITVMFAPLPPHIKDFQIVQVTITNGSPLSWTVKPTDFTFVRQDGGVLLAMTADEVVSSLLERAGRNDVIKLQLLYENSIYALSNYRPTNGYEQRREAAMAQFVNSRFSAAAAASAIALAPVKLKPGDSTDGAVFFEIRNKEHALGTGRLTAHTCGEMFSFAVVAEPKLR